MRSQVSKIDYPAILEEAWQQHLAPRKPDAPTVVSLFAGCGGSSLGYSMAGFKELLAVEWDSNAVKTFRLNFPDVLVYHGDIYKLTVEQCLEMTGLQPGELDLLDGSPPCQGFSTAGKRKLDDNRNQLYHEFVRLLRGLQPKVFVMENVSGLVKGKMKLVFADIMRALKASGYKVSCRLMNAMYFHVPQSRQRLIWIGVRDGLGVEPSYPEAESKPITVSEALTHCQSQELPPVVKWEDAMPARLKRCKPGQSISDFHGFGHDWKRLDTKKPFPTLPKNIPRSGYCLQFIGNMPLTGGQARRAGSFPDDFVFMSKYQDVIAGIGNSVPPLFMRAIALHIKREILQTFIL